MTLQNLLGVSLDAVTPERTQVARMLAAAERNMADAKLSGLSVENRFDVAYKAIMQLAMLALYANGYRTLTSRPGHHQTAVQTLTLTTALSPEKVRVLDALRKQRNLTDYSGDLVPDATVNECVSSATSLHAHVKAWLKSNKPELVLDRSDTY
jgi:hypothetical protein